ncbi:MAG TPA: dihydrofolate reductase [Steroidobacteraceae bacterium]|nr:dihydrofolate reductase [Steroidobacteraceae bacterium]
MARPVVSIVVALDERNAIGHAGTLPWRLPEDLKRFKTLTFGKPIVMGRRTWDSIGKPLPGRHNIVVTRQRGLELPGATVVASLDEALRAAGDVPEVCIIGGAEIYRLALPLTDVLHVTRVHATVAADTWFPQLDPAAWTEVACERRPADERHAHAYDFVELHRVR